MAAVKKTKYGEIKISGEAIAQVAGEAATSCYGVMGLVSKPSLGTSLYEFLKSFEYIKGVYCRKTKNGYSVDVYIVVAYGVKLTEVIGEVQKKITYDLQKNFPIENWEVNVYIQDVQEVE